MPRISGDARSVPRLQREPIRDRLDNYFYNQRYHGDPNLTDETDVFDALHKEDEIRNRELQEQQSIQKWKNRTS